jgi:O-antigen ligase
VLLSVAMYLSLSRGAWLALFVGLAALALLGAHRGSLLMTAGIVGVPTVLAIARLKGYPALVDNPRAGSGQQSSGHAFGAQLILLVAAAVVVQGVVAAGRASDNLMQALHRVVRPLLVGLAITAALAIAGVYVVKTSATEGRAAKAVTGAQDWVDRQWQDFLRPTTFSAGGTARLTSAKGTRSDLYRVAVDGFDHRPLVGDGAGGFEVRWMRERRVPEKVRDAHSLYLETLGELGLVGAALLALFLGSLVVAAVRSRVRPGALARSQAAAVGAACAVWFAHSWVDWDWQMPAVTGCALLLAATLYPVGRRARTEPAEPELSET